MSSIANKIREHKNSLGDRKIAVPEWGIEFIVKPMNIETRTKIFQLVQQNDLKGFALAISLCARDESGKLIFDAEDRIVMEKEGDSAVICRVGGDIINGTESAITSNEMGE